MEKHKKQNLKQKSKLPDLKVKDHLIVFRNKKIFFYGVVSRK